MATLLLSMLARVQIQRDALPACSWEEWNTLSTAALYVTPQGQLLWHGVEMFALMGHNLCLAKLTKAEVQSRGIEGHELLSHGTKFNLVFQESSLALETLVRTQMDDQFRWSIDPSSARKDMYLSGLCLMVVQGLYYMEDKYRQQCVHSLVGKGPHGYSWYSKVKPLPQTPPHPLPTPPHFTNPRYPHHTQGA